jgi:DNA-binding transcriptional ArsR family regulator
MSAEGEDADRVWKALADPTRREVLDLLRDGPRTTGELCEAFPNLCRTAVMKHLDVLAQARLLLVQREGRQRWNYLNPVPIQEICERWLSEHTSRRSASLLSLRRRAEGREQSSGSADGADPEPRKKRRTENEQSRRKRRNDPQ